MNRKVKPITVAAFLLPGVILYGYFFLIPAIKAFYYSLTEWNGFSAEKVFIGLGNFKTMLNDHIFRVAIGNTLVFVLVGGIVVFGLAFLFTYLITCKGFKGKKLFSNYFYFPNMVSQAALAVLWVFVFSSNFGLLDAVLAKIGLEEWIIPWLGSRWSAMICIIFASSVAFVGFYLILLISASDRVSESYREAAAIDGATDLKIYFRITIPLMRDVIVISVSLWIINAIKYFELIWAMFRGMNSTTQTLGTYMFSMAFGVEVPVFELGYGSAIAVVMFLLVVILAGGFRKIFDRNDLQY